MKRLKIMCFEAKKENMEAKGRGERYFDISGKCRVGSAVLGIQNILFLCDELCLIYSAPDLLR